MVHIIFRKRITAKKKKESNRLLYNSAENNYKNVLEKDMRADVNPTPTPVKKRISVNGKINYYKIN